LHIFYNLLVYAGRTTTIKADRSEKTEIKKFFLKISGHQQRWDRPLPGAILIPPVLLAVAAFIRAPNRKDRMAFQPAGR